MKRNRIRTIPNTSLTDPEWTGALAEIGGYMPRGNTRSRTRGFKKLWVGTEGQTDKWALLDPEGGRIKIKWQGTERGPFMFYRGDYSGAEDFYDVQDAVLDGSTVYLCIRENGAASVEGVQAVSNTTYWLPLGGGGGAANIKTVQITEARNDVVKAREVIWTLTGYGMTGDEFMVAKPWYLRMASTVTEDYNGLPVATRTYDSQSRRTLTLSAPYAGAIVHQSLLPREYLVGDWLLAAQTIRQNVVEPTKPAEGVLWEDLNVDARRWETDYQVVRVCILGQYKNMLIQGSSPY